MISDYCERFGLNEDPFASQAFYITAELEQLADQITHASQFSAGFVVVCGPRGTGKTAFAKFFYSQLIATQECILLDVAVASSAQTLLLQLADFLALPVSAESTMGELLAQLRTIINNVNEAFAVTVVLDNAQLLADDTLAALVSLLQVPNGHHRPFSFVLFSELELATRLDQFQMPDVAVQDMAFPVMSATDAATMLNYRMESAGFLGQPLFSQRQVKPLWQEADGHVDKMLNLARIDIQDRAEDADTASAPVHKGGLPVIHITAVAGLLAALGLVFLYQGDDSDTPAIVTKRLVTPAQRPASVASPTVNPQPVTAALAPRDNEVLVPPERLETVRSSAAVKPPAASVPQILSVETKPVVERQADAVAQAPVLTPLASAKNTDSSGLGASSATRAASSSKAPVAPVWANDEAEILSWPSSAYSLQILGVSNRDAAKAYVQRQENKAYLRIMATQRSGKPWYIVLAGRYDSIAKAKQAVLNLPAAQIQAGPWPRKVESLQQEIRAN
ncbi:SPOR domain-containing protein [Gilvimarinus polysaccharolyticus]|uniref:SPOR domain-containing protein n=1 Tax=Gilvimarinus polysaccharolyticus TaxID=863921 RepID=UPI0006734064|nr:AAA family ATPase [Gilvimarinus polysaccharolyticus]